jgi:hypothetical protein
LLLMYTLPLASKQLLSNRTMTANFPVFILKPWHLHAHTQHTIKIKVWETKLKW